MSFVLIHICVFKTQSCDSVSLTSLDFDVRGFGFQNLHLGFDKIRICVFKTQSCDSVSLTLNTTSLPFVKTGFVFQNLHLRFKISNKFSKTQIVKTQRGIQNTKKYLQSSFSLCFNFFILSLEFLFCVLLICILLVCVYNAFSVFW